MRLELVVLPVSDVDRAKAFYRSAGFVEARDFAGYWGEDGDTPVLMVRPLP